MLGVHPPNQNRFSPLLALEPSEVKRKKTNKRNLIDITELPSLPKATKNYDNLPRFIIATATASDKSKEPAKLSSHNTFQLGRGLKHISPDFTEVKDLQSGDLMVKTKDLKSANKFLKANYIDNIPVKFTSHKTLNSSFGRVYSKTFMKHTEEDLLLELSTDFPNFITGVRKIMRKENNQLISTGTAILTFNDIRPPAELRIGYETCTVHEYIPNPLRCKNCQKLGHTKNHCKRAAACEECGNPVPHDKCDRKYCVNCESENHNSKDPNCRTYLKYKSVNKVKIDLRCSAKEAWEKVNKHPETYLIQQPTPKKSYASVAAENLEPSTSPDKITNFPKNQEHSTQLHTKIETTKLNQKSQQHSLQQTKQQTQQQPQQQPLQQPQQQRQQNHQQNIQHYQTKHQIPTHTNEIAQKNINSSSTSLYLIPNHSQLPLSPDFAMDLPEDKDLAASTNTELANNQKSKKENEKSPCSHAFSKFPELPTIITPETFRKTFDFSQL